MMRHTGMKKAGLPREAAIVRNSGQWANARSGMSREGKYQTKKLLGLFQSGPSTKNLSDLK